MMTCFSPSKSFCKSNKVIVIDNFKSVDLINDSFRAEKSLLFSFVEACLNLLPFELQEFVDVHLQSDITLFKYLRFFIHRISAYFKIIESELVNAYYLLKKLLLTGIFKSEDSISNHFCHFSFCLFTCILLAYKNSDDAPLNNSCWSELLLFPVKDINTYEVFILNRLAWSINLPDANVYMACLDDISSKQPYET